jgi:hypothetical protein
MISGEDNRVHIIGTMHGKDLNVQALQIVYRDTPSSVLEQKATKM